VRTFLGRKEDRGGTKQKTAQRIKKVKKKKGKQGAVLFRMVGQKNWRRGKGPYTKGKRSDGAEERRKNDLGHSVGKGGANKSGPAQGGPGGLRLPQKVAIREKRNQRMGEGKKRTNSVLPSDLRRKKKRGKAGEVKPGEKKLPGDEEGVRVTRQNHLQPGEQGAPRGRCLSDKDPPRERGEGTHITYLRGNFQNKRGIQ